MDRALARRASWLEHLGVWLAYAVSTALMTYPLLRSFTGAIPMDHRIKGWYPGDGDPWQYLWAFWYFWRAFGSFPPHLFWTDLVFYPTGFEMPFLTGVGAILAPAALLQSLLGLTVAYNVLWLLSFVLAGYAMYLLGRHLFQDRLVAFFCGHVFMFSSYRMMHALEHLPLVMASFLIPLFAWSLLAAVERPTMRRWASVAVVLGASAGISWYCTISLVIYLAVFTAVSIRRVWAARARLWRPLVVALVVLLVTASPFALPLLLSSARDSIVIRALTESDLYSADLLAFFVPSQRHPVFGRIVESVYGRFTGNPYEETVYLGYVLLALSAVGVWSAPRAKSRPFAVIAAVFFVLALGPFLHVGGISVFPFGGRLLSVPLPYLALHRIPVLNGVRVPSRFTEILVFALAVLAGYGLRAICERLRTGTRRVALIGALLVLVAVECAAAPFPLESTRAPAAYAAVGAEPGPFTVLELPLDWRIVKYYYYQTIHAKRLIVGHPVRSREKYTTYPADLPLMPILKDPRALLERPVPVDARRDAERLVAFFDIRYIVIHRGYLDLPVFEELDRFVAGHFPYVGRREERDVVVYTLARSRPDSGLWPKEYVIDFGAREREFALLVGWGENERWGDTTVQWSSGAESSMYLFLGEPTDRTLEARLLPLTCQLCPRQDVDVYVNGTFHDRLAIQPGWGRYVTTLPAKLFHPGLNAFTFRYAHATAPRRVVPGSTDDRLLAVAFDYLVLSPAR